MHCKSLLDALLKGLRPSEAVRTIKPAEQDLGFAFAVLFRDVMDLVGKAAANEHGPFVADP